MSWHCLWQSCLLQNSTGIPAPFETFLWLALRRGPIFGAVGLHGFCLPSLRTLHVKPASWHQAQENMNGRCNLSQLNALFAEGKTHTPWAQNWDHTFGSWAANFSIVAPFLGPESGPCFGATKWGHNTKISSPASKCVVPILGPWCMRFAFCKERVELRQVASSIHVFLRLVPGCWFHMQGTQ